MRNRTMVILGMALLALTLAPAAAQSTSADTLTPASVLMDRAEELHRALRLDAAVRVYREVVTVQDSMGELPVLALQRIATIQLSEGQTGAAATTMDRLAERAEWLGYPEIQARALIESAVLYQQLGARHAARERVRRLEPLLGSPHLDADTSNRIRSRLRVSLTLR